MRWLSRLKALFTKKTWGGKDYRFKSPIGKLLTAKKADIEIKTKDGDKKITLHHLTFIETFEVEAQVMEVKKAMEEKGFDIEIVQAASRTMRLQCLIFLSCYVKNERLFADPIQVADILDPQEQARIFVAYGEAFILTDEERGNWWRERTQASPA